MRRMGFPLLFGWTVAASSRRMQLAFQGVLGKARRHSNIHTIERVNKASRSLLLSSIPSTRIALYSKSSSFDDLLENASEYFVAATVAASKQSNGWRRISWNQTEDGADLLSFASDNEAYLSVVAHEGLRPISCSNDGTCPPSPVEVLLVRDRLVYLKRDDLLRLPHSHVSGNKARKLYALNNIPPDQFPDCIVSHGGPQSNAMLALAAIVYSKNVQLQRRDSNAPDNNVKVEDLIHEELDVLQDNHFPFDRTSMEKSSSTDADEEDEEKEVRLDSLPPADRKKRFVYYTKKLPKTLRAQPNGNLFRARLLGIEMVELDHKEYDDWFGSEWGGRAEPPPGLEPPVFGNSAWIPQGGASGLALPGARRLALEILAFWDRQGRGRHLSVCIPGGTCTTALLLHRELQSLQNSTAQPLDIRVVVIPCVGDDGYARRQMMALNTQTGGDPEDIPIVLPSTPLVDAPTYLGQPSQRQAGYFVFGTPHADILETFVELRDESRIVLDLMYGAPSWTIMLRHWRASSKQDGGQSSYDSHPLDGREIMYVHSGGLEGVGSQLLRYKHKGLIDLEQIQLPGRPNGSTR